MGRFQSLRPFVFAVVIAALQTTNAQAAILANIEGAVSVNSGNGFQPASIGSSVAPGDRVRTGDGSVDIVYDDGCSSHVAAKQVAIVLSTPPSCYGGVTYGGLKDGAAFAPEAWNTLPVAALFAGIGIFAGAIATDHHNPVSP
jgi:hypothetical protein